MAKAISVKVARTKVIDALTNKMQEMKLAKEAYEQADKQYEIDRKAWETEVSRIAFQNFDIAKSDDKNVCIRNWGHNSDRQTRVDVEISLDKSLLPVEPERPKDPFQSYGYGRNHVGNYDDRVAEIINAINILKMSDEEVVSTSTYQHVARYL
jgi:seryl-tRNA synthetase